MLLTLIYTFNAVSGILCGTIGKFHNGLAGILSVIQMVLLISSGLYLNHAYEHSNVVTVVLLSLGARLVCTVITMILMKSRSTEE